jgi:hypothetical protein
LLHGAKPGLVNKLIEPFADDVEACADGLKLDSIFAVVSRYRSYPRRLRCPLIVLICARWQSRIDAHFVAP